MKRLSVFLAPIFLLSCATTPAPLPPQAPVCPSLAVCFTPPAGCTEVIVKELDRAKATILVQAYSFTSAPIAKALVAAHERGVKVEIILDKSHLTAQYTSAPFVAKAGIPVKIDFAHGKAHNKIFIIDADIVITGSFNLSWAAEKRNAENVLIIKDKALAEKYIKNWRDHAGHSEVYMGR
jgi:phosphatidylserine/phosphatidylglycerophosphate/cardiolipin synthase-like enzyme